MVDYNIVKYCRRCRKRMLLPKGSSKVIYCDECHKKVMEEYAAEEEE